MSTARSSPDIGPPQWLEIGEGKQGSVYVRNPPVAYKVFDQSSETQRLKGQREQLQFLELNQHTGHVPKLLSKGFTANDRDPYLEVENLSTKGYMKLTDLFGLRDISKYPRAIREAIADAAESLVAPKAGEIWSDLLNPSNIALSTQRQRNLTSVTNVMFYEGGRARPAAEPYRSRLSLL